MLFSANRLADRDPQLFLLLDEVPIIFEVVELDEHVRHTDSSIEKFNLL
jgi:PII-like signaling protein